MLTTQRNWAAKSIYMPSSSSVSGRVAKEEQAAESEGREEEEEEEEEQEAESAG